jgi:hypothetical protein
VSFVIYILNELSRYSDGLIGRSLIPGKSEMFFLFSTASRPSLEPTQHPIQWVLGGKRPGREADHLPPSSADVKNFADIPLLPHTSS